MSRCLLVFFIVLLCVSASARADCVDPSGTEGHIIYNADHKAMQFCDGTTWWAMKNGEGLPFCSEGETIIMGESGWECGSGGGGATGPSVRSVETANSNGTAILTINKPAGTAENDFMVAAISRDAGGASMSAPAGWTQLTQGDTFGTTHRYAVFYKVAGPSEPADYGFATNDDNEAIIGIIISIEGNSTGSPINTWGQLGGDGAIPVTPSVTSTVSNTLLVAAAFQEGGSGGWTLPGGYTQHIATYQGVDSRLAVGTYPQAESGPSVTAAFMSIDDQWHGVTIAIAPP